MTWGHLTGFKWSASSYANRRKLDRRRFEGLRLGVRIEQDITFKTSSDGTRIAVASCGAGPVVLRAAHWMSHVDYDLQSPVWRPWVEKMASSFCYIRYDARGCGLSDRFVADLSLDAWQNDLDTVAASIAGPPFVLFAMSQGGGLAIRYAHEHPDRVSHLVLLNAYSQGARARAKTQEELLEADTLVNFIRVGWGRENPAFSQFFTHLFMPDGTAEQHRWWGDLERETTSADVAARALHEMQGMDVLHLASQIHVPTLVLHCRGDMRVPFEEGRKLASAIPGARFVALESRNHVLVPEEPAWSDFHREMGSFIGIKETRFQAVSNSASLTPAEHEVLRLLAEGQDNQSIADHLGKSSKTVRNQVSVIFQKLGVKNRSQAMLTALNMQRRD
jgi:pimeloyl-ACP methyl ester carboxylesterase/DNA-binding CsgD family transcriptional regulator